MRTATILLLLVGCTVVPKPIKTAGPSWDGDQQNSGLVAEEDAGFGITSHARDRYNALIDLYGKRFVPPLVRDAGVKPHTQPGWYLIDREHLVKFATMNRWHKEAPP